ncbi:MAG TPA: DNA-formamidopyrimidine glycosylase family protein [Acidimicrobiales bacterium]|nr:DNA-formamidopyrimidine glycosylase family protein [Acidimicrobiales bacterium]
MPEGDTLFRAARTLHAWLEGRTITAARSRTVKAPVERIVGRQVTGVEAKAKHLLITFEGGDVLHTHMRMTGSWHVYTAGERWRKPGWQAAVVLEAGDRVAVCFNAPVVELQRGDDVGDLGPDVLRPPIDHDDIGRRAATRPPDMGTWELLLDQRVVSGIGNIWCCEALFVGKVNPWAPQSSADLAAVVDIAARLMTAAVEPGSRSVRSVYGRAGKPCRRCGTPVAVKRTPRPVYWCPGCQGPFRE